MSAGVVGIISRRDFSKEKLTNHIAAQATYIKLLYTHITEWRLDRSYEL